MSNVYEHATVRGLLRMLSEAPGSTFDTILDLVQWGTDYALSGFTLYISARGGLRIDNLYVAEKPYIFRVSIPDGTTAGALSDALLKCHFPALMLFELRTTPGGDKAIPCASKPKFNFGAEQFLEVLLSCDGSETLGLFRDVGKGPATAFHATTTGARA